MKNLLVSSLLIVTLLSCSVSKKYSYNFDWHKYPHRTNNGLLASTAQGVNGTEPTIPDHDPQINPSDQITDVSPPTDYPIKKNSTAKSTTRSFSKELKADMREVKKNVTSHIIQSRVPTAGSAPDKKASGIGWVALILSMTGAILSILGMWPLGLLLCVVGLLILLLDKGGRKEKESPSSNEIETEPAKQSGPATRAPGNGFAIAGFVCSLVGLFVWPIAIAGIILSAIGLKSARRGLALAGLIIGIVALVVAIALLATL